MEIPKPDMQNTEKKEKQDWEQNEQTFKNLRTIFTV